MFDDNGIDPAHYPESLIEKHDAKIIYNDTVIDSEGNCHDNPIPSYSLVWEPGCIHLDTQNKDEAIRTAGMFIYLWKYKKVPASMADKLAIGFVRTYGRPRYLQ